jgi:hypothetical protein
MAERHEMLAEYREKSMPHFMFYRNGVLKAGLRRRRAAAPRPLASTLMC